jgi:hypothetical protein
MLAGQIIQLVIISLLATYVLALACDFAYELKMQELYRKKQQALKVVANLGKSRAVVCAKTFKIETDYAYLTGMLERKRRIIRNLMLVNRKKAAL